MRIFGFDPGYNYTGVALIDVPDMIVPVCAISLDHSLMHYDMAQVRHPQDALEWARFRSSTASGDQMVIEDYNGSSLTKEAKETVKVLGFLEYSLELDGYDVTVQAPQARLSAVSEATRLMNKHFIELANGPEKKYKDSLSAFAHAITFYRKLQYASEKK